jgi:hypothetical protein
VASRTVASLATEAAGIGAVMRAVSDTTGGTESDDNDER